MATSDALMRRVAEAAPDAVLLVAADGRIAWANPAAERLFGEAGQALAGRSVEELVPASYRAEHARRREGYAADPWVRHMGGHDLRLAARRADGTEVPVDIMLSPLDVDGETHVLAVVRDVTAWRALEDQRDAARRAAEARSQELEALNAEKNRLLGFAAHDLRNALMVVRGYSDLLACGAMGPLTGEQADPVARIAATSKTMLDLTHDLLTVSRIEEGRLVLDVSPTNLAALVEELVADARLLARPKRVDIAFTSTLAARTVLVDAGKIAQVVSNLLSNAVKYSHPDGRVEVLLSEDGDEVVLSVEDHGVGIPEEEQGVLFQPFRTTSAKPTAGEPSVGLGLAIVRRIVLGHRGRIWVDSAPGRGTAVHVALPAT